MPQTAALPMPPACKHSDEEVAVVHSTLMLQTQHLEDVRLAERIEFALHAKGYAPLRAVVVSVSARTVRLTGRVPSYYLKQMAQVTALAVPGTQHVHNGLDVIAPGFRIENC